MLLWDLENVIATAAGVVAHVLLLVGFLLREKRRPTTTLVWLLLLAFAPLVGVGLYWLMGAKRLSVLRKRSERAAARVRSVLERFSVPQLREQLHDPAARDPRTAGLMNLGTTLSSTVAVAGNDARILVDAAATYREIITAIREAKHHIHVEFYIIRSDSVGRALCSRLAERAKEGIEVRVLYDGVGSRLPRNFWKPLTDAGGQAAPFRPVRFRLRLRRRDRVDFRNHRKIVVVDGKIGFTGGINMGREYLGLDPDVGHWRDTHVALVGPAVLSLQQVFAEDWFQATGKDLDDNRFYPETSSIGGSVVQVVDSGPDQRWPSIQRLYVQAIAQARERVWITSPYFIPNPVMEEALTSAAFRGVDVRLLLPKKSDSILVGLASRSYYPELLEAGLKIYEYERGFVHAKTMVVDDWVGTVGSANMDMRSFELNFEVNAFVFGETFCNQLADVFLNDLNHAGIVSKETVEKIGPFKQLGRATARLMSPLL